MEGERFNCTHPCMQFKEVIYRRISSSGASLSSVVTFSVERSSLSMLSSSGTTLSSDSEES